MSRIFLCVTALLLNFSATPLFAQRYPSHPVKIIVTFPPGSTPDTVARVVAPRLQESLGQPFVVENRAGAGGNVGADFAAKSPADGYTLLVSTNAAVATNKVLYANLPYDPERDLSTISLMAWAPQLLVVNPSLPVGSLKDFLEYLRRNPGRVSYGSAGSGSASHLTMELLKSDAKVFAVHIPYRGFPQAVTDMLGGNIQAMFAIAPILLPHVKSGKMKGLAVTSARRREIAPEIPSVAELGFPQLESLSWIGLLAPAKTPQDIVERLASETQRILREPDARKVLLGQGFEVIAGSPAEFRKFQHAEIEKWGRVIKSTGAAPD
ncbi:MAG: tripartite tricarboxylate transporter substrate binding protein [Chloroflexi bacterium]|nr:tripartite tricarboxylate transporter substrate binding protein [Chloroflexota bacterium]